MHIDLIDAGAGRDLAYWQGVIDAAMASANPLLEGRQGPFDRACCTRLTRTLAVSTFGTPGDGRDVLDSLSEQNYFNTTGSPGSHAFLIDKDGNLRQLARVRWFAPPAGHTISSYTLPHFPHLAPAPLPARAKTAAARVRYAILDMPIPLRRDVRPL